MTRLPFYLSDENDVRASEALNKFIKDPVISLFSSAMLFFLILPALYFLAYSLDLVAF